MTTRKTAKTLWSFAMRLMSSMLLLTAIPGAAATAQSGEGVDGSSPGYVLFLGGDRAVVIGTGEDARVATQLRRDRERLLYARLQTRTYLIRDEATLRAAAALLAPQEALGGEQARLGDRQRALGVQQARLGSEQAGIAHLAAQQRGPSPDLTRRQAKVGEQQTALGREQAALAGEQDRLSRRQEESARAARAALHHLVSDAVHRGVAMEAQPARG